MILIDGKKPKPGYITTVALKDDPTKSLKVTVAYKQFKQLYESVVKLCPPNKRDTLPKLPSK